MNSTNKQLRELTSFDYYADVYLRTVERIMNSNCYYVINPDKQLLNIKPAAFKNAVKEVEPKILLSNCLRNFKGLEFISTEKDANTCLQWTGRKYERVVSVNLKVYYKLKELYKSSSEEKNDA